MPVQRLGQDSDFIGPLLAARTQAQAQRDIAGLQSQTAEKELSLRGEELNLRGEEMAQKNTLETQRLSQEASQHAEAMSMERYGIEQAGVRAESELKSREVLTSLANKANVALEENRQAFETEQAKLAQAHNLDVLNQTFGHNQQVVMLEYNLNDRLARRSELNELRGLQILLKSNQKTEALQAKEAQIIADADERAKEVRTLENRAREEGARAGFAQVATWAANDMRAWRHAVPSAGDLAYRPIETARAIENRINSVLLTKARLASGKSDGCQSVTAEEWQAAFAKVMATGNDGGPMSPQDAIYLDAALSAAMEELVTAMKDAPPETGDAAKDAALTGAMTNRLAHLTMVQRGLRAAAEPAMTSYRTPSEAGQLLSAARAESLLDQEVEQLVNARLAQKQQEFDNLPAIDTYPMPPSQTPTDE